MIIANVDLLMELKEFCFKNKSSREGIKEGGRDNVEVSEMAVDRFFRNVSLFVENQFHKKVKFDSFMIDYDGIRREINISRLYAQLISVGMSYYVNAQKDTNGVIKEEELMIFAAKLRERANRRISLEIVSSYLINKTAENIKRQLDRLASNIQRYYSIHGDERLGESEIMQLCDLYGRVLDLYVENPNMNIPDEMSEEYKIFYQKYRRTCQ